MADISEEQYLAKDFDPASLRVADLRNLLTKHDIHYPSSAKKAMLVQIFQDDLKSKAKSILGKKSKVKPSGKGIIVVAPEQDDVSEDIKLEDEEEPSPPTTRGRKSKKKTATRKTAVKQEDSESEAEPPVANTPRKSRKSLSEIEAEVIKSSKSSKSSRSKRSSSSKYDPEEAFSDYNPFQSGPETSPSSPKSTGSRRKTYGGAEEKARSVSRSGSRRKSDSAKSRKKTLEGFHSPEASPQATPESAKSSPFQRFMAPLESLTTPPKFIQRMLEAKDTGSEQQVIRRSRRQDALVASEEFAPDQLVVSDDQYEEEERTKYGWLIWLTIAVALLGYGSWWRQEKIRLGYADIGEQPAGDDGARLPLIEFLRPKPNPCPSHGICMNGNFVQCETDYVPEQHPLSFGGLVPLGVQCRPDTEKLTRIMAIADRMNDYLREKEGMVQCGTIRASPVTGPGSVIARGFSEDQLRSLLWSEKNPNVPDNQFAEYLNSALQDLRSRKEDVEIEEQVESKVIADQDQEDEDSPQDVIKTYFASTKPKMDVSCRMRIESRRLAYRFRVELGSAAALAAFVAYIRGALAHRRAEQAQIAQLVQLALDKLSDQERMHYTDPVQNPQPYMATAHLRDFLLASEHSASKRTKLWQGVQRVVESNSNVRTRQVDLRGEWHRVWEWVGYQSSAPTSPMIEGKVYPALE